MFWNVRPIVMRAALLSAVACGQSEARPVSPSVIVTVPVAKPSAVLSVAPTIPPAPVLDYLADGFSATTTRRAWLVRSGPLRFSVGGSLLHDGDTGSIRPVASVVVAERESVRLLLEMRDLRLLVHADPVALAPVACVATVLSLDHDLPADPAAGVRVAPSLMLVEKERIGDAVHVEASATNLTFDGWIAAKSLCVAHDQGELPANLGEGLVREGTRVLASPGGSVVATFGTFGSRNPMFRFRVEPEPGGPRGFQAIRHRTREVDVRGLVAVADYKPKPPGHGSLGGSHRGRTPGGGMSDSRIGMLAEGTSLLAPGTRERIGRVLHPLRVHYGLEAPDREGLVPVHFFAEELGPITVLAKEQEIGPDADP